MKFGHLVGKIAGIRSIVQPTRPEGVNRHTADSKHVREGIMKGILKDDR